MNNLISTPKPNATVTHPSYTENHTSNHTTDDRPRFCIPVEGEMYEVSEQVYRAYYKAQNREEYLAKRDSSTILSYNALDTETITGESLMPDMMDSSPEDKALADELSDLLHRCINLLPPPERELIYAIYFDRLTETEYALRANLTQSGVSKRKKKILSRLRKLMNILGSFLFFVIPPLFFYL